MRTTAVFKGHPIHQMLIPFPIGFLAGSIIFDILGYILNDITMHTTAGYLIIAGILAAVAAAIPGFIDFMFSVPPKSSGKKRAQKHMILNLTAVVIFLIAYLLRDDFAPGIFAFILQLAGGALLSAGGWMGGTLVNRNFIGPDHRFAGAGKWNQEVFSDKSGTIKVAAKDEIKNDQMKLLIFNDKRIVLGKSENKYSAFNDSCTHRGGSLAGGVLICGTVQCLWHGSQFDIHTGAVKYGPAEQPISIYQIEEKQDGIYLTL